MRLLSAQKAVTFPCLNLTPDGHSSQAEVATKERQIEEQAANLKSASNENGLMQVCCLMARGRLQTHVTVSVTHFMLTVPPSQAELVAKETELSQLRVTAHKNAVAAVS
jgi:hypothetical protein